MLMENIGFIWIDSGNEPLSRTVEGLFQFVPITSFRRKIALENIKSARYPKDSVDQSAQLLHKCYSENMDPELTRTDAFYAFHNIFEFCAFSELQFLNRTGKQIEQYQIENPMKHYRKSTRGSDSLLESLKSLKMLVESHIWQLETTLSVIRRRGDPNWPRATLPRDMKITKAAARQLEDDYEHLLSRARGIRERFSDSIAQSIAERAQNDYTKPVMALVSIASLIFTTSFFSMNFTELQDLSVWIYFVASTPFLGLSTAYFFRSELIDMNSLPGRSQPGKKLPTEPEFGEKDEERATTARHPKSRLHRLRKALHI